MLKSSKNTIDVWEIWNGEEYLGTTTSLQIAEIASENGLRVIRVQ